MMKRSGLLLSVLLALTACKEEVAQDLTPLEMNPETLGHYCQMNLLEHPGPKAQVHLDGMPTLFFSQVRDAIAYARAPEQVAPILAIYVNDMGHAAATWDDPGEHNWIDATTAFFVVDSPREGGMGLPETVPYGTRAGAEALVTAEGGRILALAEITDDMVLTPAAEDSDADDSDFMRRLRALSNTAAGG